MFMCEQCLTAGLIPSVCALTCSDRSINEKEMQSVVGSLTCCAKRTSKGHLILLLSLL